MFRPVNRKKGKESNWLEKKKEKQGGRWEGFRGYLCLYMKSGAALLDTHVVAATEDGAVSGDETGADGDTAFSGTGVHLFDGGEEAWFVGHGGEGRRRRRWCA